MSELLERLEKLTQSMNNHDNNEINSDFVDNKTDFVNNKIDMINGKSLYGDYHSKLQYSTIVEQPADGFKDQELISRELVTQEIESTVDALKTSTWVTDRVAANLLKEAIQLIRIHGGNIGDSPVSSSFSSPSVVHNTKINLIKDETPESTPEATPENVKKPFSREATSTYMSRVETVTLTTCSMSSTSSTISSSNTMSEVEADGASSYL